MDKDDRYTRITLRLPRTLHSKLAEEAERTSKSLNAEIVGRLEGSFTEAGLSPDSLDEAARLLDNYRELIKIVRSDDELFREVAARTLLEKHSPSQDD